MDPSLDFRSARRSLARNRVFSLTTSATLALGIGIVTAMFSVVYGVLLRPLPVQDQDRIVVLTKTAEDGSVAPFALADLEAVRDSADTLDEVAGFQYDGAWPIAMRDDGDDVTLRTALVSSDYFDTLGVVPAAGRTFRPEDGQPRADRAVVISHDLWRGRYGARPDVVGETLEMTTAGRSAVVVGVAPRGLVHPAGTEVWMALPVTSQLLDARMAPYSLVARLADGATPERAAAELQSFLREREATVYRPGEARGHRAVATPFFEEVVGDLRPALLVLSAAVGLLLLLVASNVANLLLVRAVSRSSEVAVRLAIGARRAHAARPLVFEGFLLALPGAFMGALIAWGMVRSIVAVAPAALGRLGDVHVDPGALGFALCAAVAIMAVAVLAPLLWILRSNIQGLLRLGTGGALLPRRLRWGNNALVACQAAVAMIVLTSAGLLGRTLLNLQESDLGFAGDQLVVANVNLPRERFPSLEERLTYYESLADRLSASPRVSSATPVLVPPFSQEGGWNAAYSLEGQGPTESARNPVLNVEGADDRYFETLGTPVLRGRPFTGADRADSRPVAIVSQSLADRAWPGSDPLEQRIRLGPPDGGQPWRSVVGVVPDTRYRDLSGTQPTVYVPYRQADYVPRRLAVRAAVEPGDVEGVYSDVRAAARQTDPGTQVVEIASVRSLMDEPLARPRFNLLLMALFALVSLLLAAVGLYGVMVTWVVQRSRELALRVALGARPNDIRRLVFWRGVSLVAIGVGLSLAVILLGGQLLSSILYRVSAADPTTLVAAALLMLLVALVSCYRPVRRALRLHPAIVLSEGADGGGRAAAPPGR